MKILIILLLLTGNLFAADQYRQFSISPITAAQYQALMLHFNDLDKRGSTVSMVEYNPTTQTMAMAFGGENLSGLLGRVRAFFVARAGRAADIDIAISAGDKVRTKNDLRR